MSDREKATTLSDAQFLFANDPNYCEPEMIEDLTAIIADLRAALALLTEVCAAKADPEHCMFVQTARMCLTAWADMRNKGHAALALADEVKP